MSILLGNGNGTFAAAVNYGAGTTAGYASVALGDVNGDGKLDLAHTNSTSNTVSILLGNGNGTFAVAVSYPVANNPHSVAIGDLNGDGKPDLAVGTPYSSSSIRLGTGTGAFGAAVNYAPAVVRTFSGDRGRQR